MKYQVRRMRDGLKYEVDEDLYQSRLNEEMKETATKRIVFDAMAALAGLLAFLAILGLFYLILS